MAIVTENLFSGRFRYVDELRRMGADIRNEGHHAVVRGVARLSGAQVRAPDLRAGAALVLAGMVADGETVVTEAATSTAATRTWPGSSRSLGADVVRGFDARTRPFSQPLASVTPHSTLPSCSPPRKKANRHALARLLSAAERGGEAAAGRRRPGLPHRSPKPRP